MPGFVEHVMAQFAQHKWHSSHEETRSPQAYSVGRGSPKSDAPQSKSTAAKCHPATGATASPNYSSGKRCFDCSANEAEAIEAATRLARKLSERQHVAANMTNSEAAGYAAAVQSLEPHSVPLTAAADTLAQCLQTTGTLAKLIEATSFWAARNRVGNPGECGGSRRKVASVQKRYQCIRALFERFTTSLGPFCR